MEGFCEEVGQEFCAQGSTLPYAMPQGMWHLFLWLNFVWGSHELTYGIEKEEGRVNFFLLSFICGIKCMPTPLRMFLLSGLEIFRILEVWTKWSVRTK